ncbi:hypothetical protein N8927_06870 [Crocinitomicaceae bacterium]|nr:hypothetical protein [Crocinitomicaceae bacterium]
MINHFKNYCVVLLLLFPLGVIFSQSTVNERYAQINAFEEIDEHVRDCPKEIKSDPDQLVEYLDEVAETDLEKARALYVWLADNISYNAKALNKNKYGDNSAEGVLKSKKAVCAGYANLFELLGKKMGLDILIVGGYSKNANDEQEWYFVDEEPGHAWNVIKINGAWKVFDATWGAGIAYDDKKGRMVFKKQYTDNWFNLSTYQAIFTHYPEDTSFMFINPKITLEEYEKFPNVSITAFASGLLNAKESYLQSVHKPSIKYPVIYDMNLIDLEVLQAPKTWRMKRRKRHIFKFNVSNVLDIYLYENDDLKDTFKKENEGHNFTFEYMNKEKAKVDIVIKTLEGELYTLMEYENY